jgi:hypothetical protein
VIEAFLELPLIGIVRVILSHNEAINCQLTVSSLSWKVGDLHWAHSWEPAVGRVLSQRFATAQLVLERVDVGCE